MSSYIGKPQMLKELNTSLIEQLLYEKGPLTKPELARLTSLSLPTVSKLVDDLEEQGAICQVGLTGKGAGRKAVLYETNKDSGCLAVLYYRRGELISRLTDITGGTLHEAAFPLDVASLEAALDSTVRAIDSLRERARTELKCIGIGVPGAVRPDGRLLGIPKIAPWEGLNLEERLTGHYGVDVCVENDVKLSAVGYYHTHLSEKLDNMVYLYAGNGMGAGIIIHQKLYRGAANFSGELGFMAPLDGKAPAQDFTHQGGYLETQLRRYADSAQGECWQKDDPAQRQALTRLLGAAAANHVAILNPDVIVLGGEAFDQALTEDIRGHIACYIPQESMPQTLYDPGEDMGIEGLILTCRGYITTRMQLVRSGGV